jgi:16S rRNA G966 N2-methylase RsmD
VAILRQQNPESLDLVFLDPPFASALFVPALQAARTAIKSGAMVYLEAPKRWTENELKPLGYALHRQLKAGQVWAHLLLPDGLGS